MAELVVYDPKVHMEDFRQLDAEYHVWMDENYAFNLFENGPPIETYVTRHLDFLAQLKLPEGIFYLLEVDGEFNGMGGLRKLSDDVARIMWMYIRPKNRGRGYGKSMLIKLLEDGRKYGCIRFQLRPPKFGHAAIGLYRNFGFKEISDSESMMPPVLPRDKPYWIDMEKKK
jgi:GNAT superfamily N-acetyltransferase